MRGVKRNHHCRGAFMGPLGKNEYLRLTTYLKSLMVGNIIEAIFNLNFIVRVNSRLTAIGLSRLLIK